MMAHSRKAEAFVLVSQLFSGSIHLSSFFIQFSGEFEILLFLSLSALVLCQLAVGLIYFCSSLQFYCELSLVLSPFCPSSATWLSLQGTDKFCCKASQLSTAHPP